MNAYEFVFFSDNLVPKPEKLTALDVFRKSLALGTSNSSVHFFNFELIEVGSSVEFSIGPVQQRNLGLKKPISQLEICDNKKLVVLCDNILQVLSLPNLEPSYNSIKLKNVTSFQVYSALYEKSMEIYIGTKKKAIQLALLGESKPHVVREINLPEVPLCFRVDGDQICVGLWSRYLLVTCPQQSPHHHHQQPPPPQLQELFSLDDGQRANPIVESVEKGEFLVTGMNNLGIFVSAQDGASRRPPLQLDSNTLAIACAAPYVLSLSDEFLTVHSGLHYERQQVQTHSVNGGLALAVARDFARCGALSHLILIACQSGDIQAALPLPWYSQVEQMLREGQVDEAMRVAEHARQSASDAGQMSEALLGRYRRLQQSAGVVWLHRAVGPGGSPEEAQKATQYLVEGRVDPRHLLAALCPGLLPQQQLQQLQQLPPPPESLAALAQLCAAEPERGRASKAFLLDLLMKYRVSRFTRDCRREADTALLKLCAELQPDQCETLIYSDLDCDPADSTASLTTAGRHHALALFLRWLGRVPEACQVWRELADGARQDPHFPGVTYFADYLATLDDPEVFWPHAEHLLAQDPECNLRVIASRRRGHGGSIQPVDIVARLETRSPRSLLLYLEFLLLLPHTADGADDARTLAKDERLHTRLCVLYLDALEDAQVTGDSEALVSLQSRLLTFLRHSTAYRAQFVLGRLQQLQSRCPGAGLQPHRAEVLARCGDHAGALRVLLLDLGDPDAAAELCAAQRDPEPFWAALLAICLSPEHRDRLLGPAVRLLNRPDVSADGAAVLPLLPANYPVGPLAPFLCPTLRRALARRRAACLAKGLAVTAQQALSAQLAGLPNSRRCIRLVDTSRCAVCSGRFESHGYGEAAEAGGASLSAAFVLTPSGEPAHLACCRPWAAPAATNGDGGGGSGGSVGRRSD